METPFVRDQLVLNCSRSGLYFRTDVFFGKDNPLVESISRMMTDAWGGTRDIIEFLVEDKDSHPLLCGRVLKTLLDSPNAQLYLADHEGKVTTILEAMIRSDNEQARELAREIINRFGELGVFGYKSLLY
jgi:hypothetical protein